VRIAVCVKQVPNPDTPAAVFRVDETARELVLPPGQPLAMSPFDEQALEAALRIRDELGGTVGISALTLGPDASRSVLKHALAMGADEGVLLADPALLSGDSYATALALAAAVRKLGAVDLVLAGRQAADTDAGAVGIGMAELLGWTAVTFAKEVRVAGATARVTRVLDDGLETVEAPLPLVVTVSNELGAPRKPSLRETMRAARKPVAAWGAGELGLAAQRAGAAGARRVRERLFVPARESHCEFIAGATPQEQASALARCMRDAKLL